jgi:hypothetical protein
VVRDLTTSMRRNKVVTLCFKKKDPVSMSAPDGYPSGIFKRDQIINL